MPNLTQKLIIEGFYQTETTEEISTLGDIDFEVTTPPENIKGFIIIDPNSVVNREIMFYDDVIGSRIYVKGINRQNAKTHSIGATVQINDVANIFNYLSENLSTTFYVEKTGSLSVKIWGGPVLKDNAVVSVEDTALSLTDNDTNYICYNHETNTISKSLTEDNIVVAEVTTASGIITDIKYRNHKIVTYDLSAYMQKSVYDPSSIEGNVYLMDNMIEGTDTKILTAAERTTIANQSGTNTGDQDLSSYATKTGTETLTNKTINASSNTISNISPSMTSGASGNSTTFVTGDFTYANYVPKVDANGNLTDGYAIGTSEGQLFLLGAGGLVPSGLLPSYVDDVLEYDDLASFPVTGETGKIYVAKDTNITYRRTGSVYIDLSATGVAVWGNVTGTLGDQTDLVNEFALYAKLAGTEDVTISKLTPILVLYDTYGDGITFNVKVINNHFQISEGGTAHIDIDGDGNILIGGGTLKYTATTDMGATDTDVAHKKYVDDSITTATGNMVESDTTGVTGADQILNIMSLTTAEYSAIGTPDSQTLYIITDS